MRRLPTREGGGRERPAAGEGGPPGRAAGSGCCRGSCSCSWGGVRACVRPPPAASSGMGCARLLA
jgi:hypothetical protein